MQTFRSLDHPVSKWWRCNGRKIRIILCNSHIFQEFFFKTRFLAKLSYTSVFSVQNYVYGVYFSRRDARITEKHQINVFGKSRFLGIFSTSNAFLTIAPPSILDFLYINGIRKGWRIYISNKKWGRGLPAHISGEY